jgi:CHAD domain-containing protein/CYTH domain-containing protein
MPDYPAGLLSVPPAVAVEAFAAVLLSEAEAARGRLAGRDDDEALHDFRVAVRRLRSVLRAFKPCVDHEMTGKLRRRLRDLARDTNTARDREVLVTWVRERHAALTRAQRVGGRWLEVRLQSELDEAYVLGLDAIERRFPALDRSVRRRLGAAAQRPWGGSWAGGTTFAAMLHELVGDHLESLRGALDAVGGPDDEQRAHAARISAKRLRYLVELVEGELDGAKEAVSRLKALQTLLGDLHDVQVADPAFRAASEVAAAEHALRLNDLAATDADQRERRRVRQRNAVPGLLALNRLGRDARRSLYQRFRTWRDEQSLAVESEVTSVLQGLRDVVPASVEIERKYLLKSLPDRVATADVVEVEQGWLPGSRLQERVRRVTAPDGDRFYRTVKFGRGLSRLEVEEEATAEVFERLWPLTESRRVRKRRYYVTEGTLTWEIDEFLDRPLVLAEVELPTPDTDVPLPEWVANVLDREVTGEPAYVNVNLAR